MFSFVQITTSYGSFNLMHLLGMLKLIAKIFSVIILIIGVVAFYFYGYSSTKDHLPNIKDDFENEKAEKLKLKNFSEQARLFCKSKGYNTDECFLIDMSLPSGKNRMFEYDMKKDSVISYGLVAHGSCNTNFLATPKFSNKPGCGCTALGKYKIGGKYVGRFGNAYKLYGLDSTNSNAYKRNIVLHSYYMVPAKETDPVPICNSLGCAMISTNYLTLLSKKIDASGRPILLWVFE